MTFACAIEISRPLNSFCFGTLYSVTELAFIVLLVLEYPNSSFNYNTETITLTEFQDRIIIFLY